MTPDLEFANPSTHRAAATLTRRCPPKDQREDHRHQAHQEIDDDGVEQAKPENASQHRQAKLRVAQANESAQRTDAGPPGKSLHVSIHGRYPEQVVSSSIKNCITTSRDTV